jgi:hypothetical protein
MPSAQKLDTHHKALTLNLDPSTFGSFAEIGAGYINMNIAADWDPRERRSRLPA